MNKFSKLIICAALGSGASAFAQQSAWLPAPREFLVTPAFTYQTYDRFWAGKTKGPLPTGGSLNQETASITLEYGLCEAAAADLSFGYVWTDSKGFGGGKQTDDGLTDTSFGLRYRFLDETKTQCKFAPTMALRVGGIIEGTYDQDFPFSGGDGASGFETSLLFGKAICPGFGLYGDIGYRNRNHRVPDDLFGSAGVYATYKCATATLAYRHVQGLSGGDIGGPGFGAAYGFPQVKEISQNIEAGLGIRDKAGRYYQFFYARTIEGRNTGEKNIFGISATIPFGGK